MNAKYTSKIILDNREQVLSFIQNADFEELKIKRKLYPKISKVVFEVILTDIC